MRANNKTKSLNMKWMHTLVKTLGVQLSYDKQNISNFSLKLRKLDM